MFKLLLTIGIVALLQQTAVAQATQPADDAAKLYLQAAQILSDDDAKNIMSPASSSLTYPDYPPMTDAWLQMEKPDYELHAQVRELMHEAATLNYAAWPPFVRSKGPSSISYLNGCRNLANEIADASLYQSLVLNDQPAAFQTAGDLFHLADLLKNQPGEILIRLLVGEGLEAIDTARLMDIISGVKITQDATNTRDLPLTTATQWISRLLDHPSAQAELDQSMRQEPAGATTNPSITRSLIRILEEVRRIQSGRDMAAMSLAAHVYQSKHGQWPANLQQLSTELPRLPIDPWGDGKQTLGYALIQGGLPDGNDRPLVYSRCGAKNGLYYRIDQPIYSFTQSGGGQFRDVASWFPPESTPPAPTTQPLE